MNKNYEKDKIKFKHIFFSTYGWICFTIVLLIQLFIFLPLSVLLFITFIDRNRKSFPIFIKIAVNIFLIIFIGHKISFTGIKLKAPKKGEKRIYILNHASLYDVVVMYLMPGPIKFIIKEKWVKKPFIGWMQYLAGNIIVKENSSSDDAMAIFENAKKALNKGIPILIYPEGTRSHSGKIQKFKKGSFKIAIETEADIVPVVMDTWNCIRPSGMWIRDVKPEIKICEPIKYDSYKHLSHIQLSKVMHVFMMKKLIEIRDKRRQNEKHYYRKNPVFINIDDEMKKEADVIENKLLENNLSLK